MQPLNGGTMPDPTPSRLRYRLHRLWLSPAFRRLACIVLVSAVAGLFAANYARNSGSTGPVAGAVSAVLESIVHVSAVRVVEMRVTGVDPEVAARVEEVVPFRLPASSSELDLGALRMRIEALDSVSSASLFLRANGILDVLVVGRVPVAVWRNEFGLNLIDEDGVRAGVISSRNERRDLPLLIGEGVPAAVSEARQLGWHTRRIADRILGFRRVGERRWDIFLDGGQTIMLPESNAADALKRIMELHETDQLLDRKLLFVDFRIPERPVLRLRLGAGDAAEPVSASRAVGET